MRQHVFLSRLLGISVIILFLIFVPSWPAYSSLIAPLPPASPSTPPAPSSPDEIIVKYKAGALESDKQNVRKQSGAILKHRINKLKIEVIHVPSDKKDLVLQSLNNNPFVQYAEPDFIAQATSISNDPSLPQQWGLFKINATNTSTQSASAWDITHGDPSIKVAILDTGIDESHPDLTGKVILDANFTTDASSLDNNGHGSHVAGIVAANTNNGTGVAGAGYNTGLINGKVLDSNGSGYYSWIINGITWAADNGAQVISMSLGGSSSSQALSDAVNYAWSKGAVVVAAAGNNGSTAPSYPAYYPNVIAVAATDSNDNLATWSNRGSWVDVASPGVNIYSTYDNNSYATLSGTSMATPFVAGEAALIFATGLCATNTCTRNQIETTADHISGTGTYFTYGRINTFKAVSILATPSATPTPTPTTTPTPTPTAKPTPTPLPTMTASNISLSYTTLSGAYRRINTTVTVINEATSTPLSSATVKLQLKTPSGTIYSYSATTNTSGKVSFKQRTKEKGTFISTIIDITRSGYTYHPTLTSNSSWCNKTYFIKIILSFSRRISKNDIGLLRFCYLFNTNFYHFMKYILSLFQASTPHRLQTPPARF